MAWSRVSTHEMEVKNLDDQTNLVVQLQVIDLNVSRSDLRVYLVNIQLARFE